MGIVGVGAIGIRGALSHLTMGDVQYRVRVVAVCDPAPGRAEAAAAKYGVPASYLTFEELLADPNVDAVTLCSPIGLHFEQGMTAIAAGKHVHFNKTMAVTALECTDMIDLAAEKGVHLVASPGQMLRPENRRVRQRILQGDLGQLLWAICGTAPWEYHFREEFRGGQDVLTQVDPTWYFRKPGGGPLWDTTVYPLHTLTGLLGPAKRITAMSGLRIPVREFAGQQFQCDMDDSTFMLLDFGESLFAVVYGTLKGNPLGGNPCIFGTAGQAVGSKVNDEEMKQEGDHEPHVVGEHAKIPENHVFEDMMQLVDWIRDGTPSIASAEHARHVVDIFESAYRAAATSEAQELTTTFEPLTLEDC
jgi:predicted dehydrogenase